MIKQLMEIEKLLDRASVIYESLPDKAEFKINDFHTELYTLDHCLRWGLQAAQENIEGIEEDVRSGAIGNLKVGNNQVYYDKMASEFIVEQYEYDGWEGGKQVPMYSVVDGFDDFMDAVKCAENPRLYMKKRSEVSK